MKAFLMYRDRDFQATVTPNSTTADLMQDLELETLLRAMANGDSFLLDVAKASLLTSLDSGTAICYRQNILTDCLEHSSIVREMYDIAVEAAERERKAWGWTSMRYPEQTLHRTIEVLGNFSELLRKLRHIVETKGGHFRSEGFRRFFEMITTELAEEYMQIVDEHLERLKFRGGMVMSADLGQRNKGVNYVLRKPREDRRRWWVKAQDWLGGVAGGNRSKLFYEIAERDEAGFRALSEITGEGVGQVAAALAQSSDHILSFFNMLRQELGFYIGCLNLRDHLTKKSELICLPEPAPLGEAALSTRGLYDPCLSLSTDAGVVGNDVSGSGKNLLIITGANRGGKSTLLRSLGLAQVMMQCGMFVAAESFRADVRTGVFTHFKREEDVSMKSGKLDDELRRMTTIVDHLSRNSVILFNESFASTNEREGSAIARQIVRALLERDIKIVYVTHMYDLAHGFYASATNTALFLRAERLEDGRRTFRLFEGEPLPTSHGGDLYRQIFKAA
jgi:MutS domain V